MSTKIFTIGELAEVSGTTAVTIRYYEKCDLLPNVDRSEGGHRLYSEDTLRYLRFIHNAKEVGFSLDDIRELLSLKASKKGTGQRIKKITLEKINHIDEKMTALQQMKQSLLNLANSCDGSMPIEECPILKALEQDTTALKKSAQKKASCCKQ